MTPILPGLDPDENNPRRAAWLGLGIVAMLLVSRFVLLPDGPWEQDEALLATGVLDFDVVRHRPHPPGFPGWIALGKILHPLTGDALLALRIWSCLASVVTVVVLARLLVPLVGDRIALLGALAYGFVPVTWAHAPRAFTTTPALACAVVAAWLWTRRATPSRRETLGAWALLGLAATIRPQLAPELALVGLVGLRVDRRARGRLAGGIGLAVGIVVLAYGAAALDAPSAAAYWHSVSAHFARHSSDVATSLPWTEYGIVRGLGGSIPAAIVAALTVLGLVRMLERHRLLGAWMAALVLVTAVMVFRAHHPGFPRYGVVLLLAATAPTVYGVAALPPVGATVVLTAAIVAGAFTAIPPMAAMRRVPLPPVAALRRVSAGDPSHLVYSHGSFSFARYHAMSGGLEVPAQDIASTDAIPALPRGAYALGGRTLHFLPGATVCSERFDRFPEAARALSQDRFTSAEIARDAIILGAGVHRPETTPDGDPFAWLSGLAALHVPGGAETLALQVRVTPGFAPQRVEARVGARVVLESTALDKGPQTLRIPLVDCDEGCVVRLRMPDARSARKDRRRLSLRVEAAWSEGTGIVAARHRWSPGLPPTLRAAGVETEGTYNPERFSHDRPGAWTRARMKARFPGGPGTLTVHLARPPHTPGEVVLSTEADRKAVEIGRKVTPVPLRVSGDDGTSHLEIVTPTFVPAEVNPASEDGRELGVILYDVEYVPDDDPCGR